MHVRRSIPLLLAAVGFLPVVTSCDASVDFWDQRTLTVNIAAGDATSAQSDDQLVDISQDPDIKSHISSIKSMDIVEIWLQIASVDPSNTAVTASGTLMVKGPAMNDQWEEVGSYSGLSIQQGGKIEITPDSTQQAILDQVRQWASTAPYQFHVKYSGAFQDASGQPTSGAVNFQVQSRIHLNATVGL